MLGLPNRVPLSRGSTAPAADTLTWSAPDLGFRAITTVRVVVGDDTIGYEVDGVRNRRPVTVPVSEGMAVRLIAAGTPMVRRVQSSARRPEVVEVGPC